MKPKIDYTLYLVTDSDLCPYENMPVSVEKAIQGGVTLVQLREKETSTLDFYNIALKIKCVTDKYNIPLLINDRIDIALAVDCAGVHIGQTDMPMSIARKILGENKIIGVSAGTIEEAVKAEKEGADYIGFGAVYYTDTKKIKGTKGPELLNEVKEILNIPVVGIGGINKSNADKLKNADGIAVVSAIMGKEDEKKEAEELIKILRG